jgi:hypothetical protein
MKSNNTSLVTYDKTNFSPVNGEGLLPRTLFVHIPKSGGTTLDSIISDQYLSLSIARNIQFSSSVSSFLEIDKVENCYVSGHFPVSIVDLEKFERKITIIRNPIDILCSVISFTEKMGIQVPRLSAALEGGGKYEIYREYFSTNFDFGRFKIDKNYGMVSGYSDYIEKSSVCEALDTLDKFNIILDFNRLDDGIKTMIMSYGFFPYSNIARNRFYDYQRDYESAIKLLSDFDEYFYSKINSRFAVIADNIALLYDQYKESYCKEAGISLEVYEGLSVDLRGPIGLGWNNFEISELGAAFRWSETANPTIELPIAIAGSYMLYFYWLRGHAKNVTFRISTLIGEIIFVPTIITDGEVCICRCYVTLNSPDWIYAKLEIEECNGSERQSMRSSSVDIRSLGIVLGNVYIRRVASI